MGGGETDTDTHSPLISTPEDESPSEKEYSGEFDDMGSWEWCSTLEFEAANQRRRLCVYSQVLRSYDDLRRRSLNNLEDARSIILSYTPGAWIEKVGGMRLSDYDVPNTTSLLLIGPRGAGKSSLVNRISRVFDVDKFASERAQVSYNSSFGDGTLFLKEYMIPRHSTSFCLYDTRSMCDDTSENMEMLKHWMTKGVRHGELVIRGCNSSDLKTRIECKARQSVHGEARTVSFVIFVIDALLVLKSMDSNEEADQQYTQMIATTFNCPFLSFKDDKPVVVVTHGDLLSLSDRARIRVHLGELLGIPPMTQIFDIPESCDPATELTILDMLRYSLEHADRNLPGKDWYKRKVCRVSLASCLFMLIILGIAIVSAYIHPLSASGSPTPIIDAPRFTFDLDKATQNHPEKHGSQYSQPVVTAPESASDLGKATQNHANKYCASTSCYPVIDAPQFLSDLEEATQNQANKHRASQSSRPVDEPEVTSDHDEATQNHTSRSSKPVVKPKVTSDVSKATQSHANKHHTSRSSKPVVKPIVTSDVSKASHNKSSQNHGKARRVSRSSRPVVAASASESASDLGKATQNHANEHRASTSSQQVIHAPQFPSVLEEATQNQATKHRVSQSSKPVDEPEVASDHDKAIQNHANKHHASRSSKPVIKPKITSYVSKTSHDKASQNHGKTYRVSRSSEPVVAPEFTSDLDYEDQKHPNFSGWASMRHLWLGSEYD